MSYKFSRGYQIIGDLSGSDDAQRDTGIDFEDNYIGLQTSGSTVFVVSGSKVGIGTTTPSHKLDVNGDVRVRGNDIRDNSGNPAISFDIECSCLPALMPPLIAAKAVRGSIIL